MAWYACLGHRRALDVALLLPRARVDPRSVRGVLRRPVDDEHDGDRWVFTPDPRKPSWHGPRFPEDFPGAPAGVRGPAFGEPDLDGPHQGSRGHPGRRRDQLLADRSLSARLRRELRHPQSDALLRLRPPRFRGASGTARGHL